MEYIYNSPIGELLISYNNNHILSARFDQKQHEDYVPNAAIAQCIKELDEYFAGTRTKFDVAVNPHGTDFQKATWDALCTISHGKTASYGEIAAKISRPKAARAVGMANNKNPIYIIIPCHRVVGANGALTGYGGGLWRKEWLLEHEAKSHKR